MPNTDTLYTALFEDPSFEEAFGSVNMQCHIVSHEPDPHHPTRPIIHFAGGSENEPYLCGWVKLTPDGHIRWHFVSARVNLHSVEDKYQHRGV